MRRVLLTLAVALALATSGCTISGGDSEDDATGSTLTPAPVPGEVSFDRLAPVGEDFQPLLDRHRSAIENESYSATLHVRSVENATGPVLTNATFRGFIGTNRSVYYDRRRLDDDTRYTVWSNGTLAVSQLDRSTGRSYRVQPPLENEQLALDRLSERLSVASITNRTQDGDRLIVRGRFTDSGRARLAGDGETVERSSVRVTVTTDGVIERFAARWVVRQPGGRTVARAERITFDPTADTLPRPDWVETALASERGR